MSFLRRLESFAFRNFVYLIFFLASYVSSPSFYTQLSWWGLFAMFFYFLYLRDLELLHLAPPTFVLVPSAPKEDCVIHKHIASDDYLKSPFKK